MYLALTFLLPLLWCAAVALSGGYDSRIVGSGAEEFHRILRAGVSLTACVAIFSYATKLDLARGYVVLALPSLTALDMLARYVLRKRLHRQRRLGICTRRAVVVGPARAVTEMITALGRDSSHGLHVVAACVPGRPATPGRDRGRPGVRRDGQRDRGRAPLPGRHGRRGELRADGRRPAPRARLGAGKDRHGPVRGPGPARPGRPAHHDPPGRRAPAGSSGPRQADRAPADRERDIRPDAGGVGAGPALAAAGRDRLRDPLLRRRSGPVPPHPDRQGRPPVHRVQVPQHGGQRRGPQGGPGKPSTR